LPVTFNAGRATSKWYFDLWLHYQKSFGRIDYMGTPRSQNFRELTVKHHRAGGTFYKSLGASFGSYGSFSYTISGRNVFQGASYGIGFVYDFKVK
jgi:hypothetical protein